MSDSEYFGVPEEAIADYAQHREVWSQALMRWDARSPLREGNAGGPPTREGVWREWLDRLDASVSNRCRSSAWQRVVLGSRYFRQVCELHPEDVWEVLATVQHPMPLSADQLTAWFVQQQTGDGERASESLNPYCFSGSAATLPSNWAPELSRLDDALRRFRRMGLCRLIWCDILGIHTLEDRMAEWSRWADTCLQIAVTWHYQHWVNKWGKPVDADGRAIPFMVVALGKLGADELNLSSDIDLMFTVPEFGQLYPPNRVRTAEQWFTRVGQGVIQTLDRVTAQGFVFRVDMRLRPYGSSGALVMPFSALARYYQTQGWEWERFAMIKARIAATSPSQDDDHRDFWAILRPFSYRRYVDYSVLTELRALKAMIQQEVKRKNIEDDIKLGWGGIREIEFVVQVFQLIHGGRDRLLQEPRLLKTLPELARLGYLSVADAQALSAAYDFLRRMEHLLQAWDDRQTQALPRSEVQQGRLAWLMGYKDWPHCQAELNQHRVEVDRIFSAVIEDGTDWAPESDSQASRWWQALQRYASSAPQTEAREPLQQSLQSLLPQCSAGICSDIISMFLGLLQHRLVRDMPDAGRERLNRFVPRLLESFTELNEEGSPFSEEERVKEALLRLVRWMESVSGRSGYFVLLLENPEVVPRFVQLVSASAWIADQLTQYPALLEDAVLDPLMRVDSVSLNETPAFDHDVHCRSDLQARLQQVLLRIPPDDEEQHMEALRYFRRRFGLKIATQELLQSLPLMQVSDALTWLAEVLLEAVLEQAWQQMVARFGCPPGCSGIGADKGFVIIGYGKLGGLEMSHQSDLDLVFIYQGERQERTQGAARSLDIPTFYTRLGQKVIHALTTRTWSGRLYEVDMRLRPSGNSGLLVTRWEAFEQYQRASAWVWEHQALVRARPVAGCPTLGERFMTLRASILSQDRDITTLQESVVAMREKMRAHLNPVDTLQGADLKHSVGGIVDIEFMVQYAVLAWASEESMLLAHTDNIRLLETLGRMSHLPEHSAQTLIEAYQAMRRLGHRRALQQRNRLISETELLEERRQVSALWRVIMLGMT